MKFSDQDRFEFWLMEMNDSIQRFLDSLPEEIARQLGFSVDSLTCLELWLISRYQGPAEIMRPTEAQAHDGAARYIGETFRRSLGGNGGLIFLIRRMFILVFLKLLICKGRWLSFARMRWLRHCWIEGGGIF